MWLKLSSTDHNPAVIARYYLESVENAGGNTFCVLNCEIHYAVK